MTGFPGSVGFWPTTIIEKYAKFQLKVNKNEGVIFPIQAELPSTLFMGAQGYWDRTPVRHYPQPLANSPLTLLLLAVPTSL